MDHVLAPTQTLLYKILFAEFLLKSYTITPITLVMRVSYTLSQSSNLY